MEEEADRIIVPQRAEFLGQRQQVIVVDPDKIAILSLSCYGFGEEAVDLGICFPRRFVGRRASWKKAVVQLAPDNKIELFES
jgi:hypothetical protein